MQQQSNVTPAATFIAQRFHIPPHTAAVIAELAGLGRLGDWRPIGNAVVPTVLQAAAVRSVRRAS